MGIAVKVVTSDNLAVAVKVYRNLGLTHHAAMTGAQVATLDDDSPGPSPSRAIASTTVLAWVSRGAWLVIAAWIVKLGSKLPIR